MSSATKVEYYLSEEGKTLRVLIAMSIWGEKRVRKLQVICNSQFIE